MLVPLGTMREGSSTPHGQGLTRGWPCCIFGCRELSWSSAGRLCAMSELSVPVLCSDLPPCPAWSWCLGCVWDMNCEHSQSQELPCGAT